MIRNTTTALVFNTIHKTIRTSKAVDILYLDFRKTFDTVSHDKLLGKLWSIGIRGYLWQWFKAYLSNNLPNCVSSSTSYLFADDTKCLKVISNQTDIQILQEDLANVSNWSHAKKLLFNKPKSTHLHCG